MCVDTNPQAAILRRSRKFHCMKAKAHSHIGIALMGHQLQKQMNDTSFFFILLIQISIIGAAHIRNAEVAISWKPRSWHWDASIYVSHPGSIFEYFLFLRGATKGPHTAGLLKRVVHTMNCGGCWLVLSSLPRMFFSFLPQIRRTIFAMNLNVCRFVIGYQFFNLSAYCTWSFGSFLPRRRFRKIFTDGKHLHRLSPSSQHSERPTSFHMLL